MEAVAVAAVLVLALVAWNAIAWPRLATDGAGCHGTMAILIPARDERDNIEACLASAVLQGDQVVSILVYDDHSTDGTDALVRRAAETDNRVRLIEPEPLPEGWKGKPFACSRLAAQARADWLLFMDADAVLEPGAASAMVRAAEDCSTSLMSFWPRLVMVGFAEQMLMPLLNLVVFSLFPAALAARYPWPSLGLAHGACMLFEADTYRRLGGHELVSGELFEDTALAREWRRHGEKSLCIDGQDAVRVRMYRSFKEMWFGFSKNICPAFRTQAGFWLFLTYHLAVFVVPLPWLLFAVHSGRPIGPAMTALFAGAAMRWTHCVRFGYPVWSVVLHPVAEAVLVALGLSSWWAVRSGRGVVWKGRRYGVR